MPGQDTEVKKMWNRREKEGSTAVNRGRAERKHT